MGNEDAPWVFGVEMQSREEKDKMREHLARFDIETRNYFHPLHLQPVNYFSGTLTYDIKLPVCESQADKGFYLPSHTYIKDHDIAYICAVMQNYFDSSLETPTPEREYGWANQARLDWEPSTVDGPVVA